MAQWIKFMPLRHEDLSSDPCMHKKTARKYTVNHTRIPGG